MKTSVAEFFDSYAHDFDAIYGTRHTAVNRLINQLFRTSMRLRYQKTIEGCDPIEGRSLVDIGCGPGHFGIALASKGAGRVLGLDFAEQMLAVARRHAQEQGVADRCEWELGDFLTYPFQEKFDYAIVCGFMDYVAEPTPVIDKVLSITRSKAFFSFPTAAGMLAWQRRVRYRSRCDLFMYTRPQLEDLFRGKDAHVTIEPIARDFFVTATKRDNSGQVG